MPTFKPSSVFGRNVLRSVFEFNSVSCQFLRLPSSIYNTDLSEWTWKDNWSKYVVTRPLSSGGTETLYSGADNSLSVNSLVGGEGENIDINLYVDEGTDIVGAYYTIPESSSGIYAQVYNDLVGFGLNYTHCAVFVNDTLAISPRKRPEAVNLEEDPELEANLDYFEERLIFVVRRAALSSSLEGYTIAGQSYEKLYFNILEYPPGAVFTEQFNGPYATSAVDFDDLITRIEDSINSLNAPTVTEPWTTALSTQPPVYAALQGQQFLTTAYQKTFVSVPGTELDQYPAHNCLIELLNVTTTPPADDSDWDTWSTHRTNRYYIATASGPYLYTPQENQDIESFDYYGTTITITTTYTGTTVKTQAPFEILISPPSSGSFSFTHLAVFTTDRTQPPASGVAFTYPNTDRFVGVIEMDASVTVSSSDTVARLIPLDMSLLVGPLRTVTVEFS